MPCKRHGAEETSVRGLGKLELRSLRLFRGATLYEGLPTCKRDVSHSQVPTGRGGTVHGPGDQAVNDNTLQFYTLSSPQPRPGGDITGAEKPITVGSVPLVLVDIDVFHRAKRLARNGFADAVVRTNSPFCQI